MRDLVLSHEPQVLPQEMADLGIYFRIVPADPSSVRQGDDHVPTYVGRGESQESVYRLEAVSRLAASQLAIRITYGKLAIPFESSRPNYDFAESLPKHRFDRIAPDCADPHVLIASTHWPDHFRSAPLASSREPTVASAALPAA